MNKVLVTGAGGFIGSHLTELLVKEGYEVRAFIKYNSRNFWGHLDSSPVANDIEIISGDVRDFDSVKAAMKDCHSVFHLAALIGIPYSYVSPLAYIKTNVEGTYNVLQSARDLGLDKVMITSTSETYGSAQYIPIDELHELVGQSPYSASKIGADHLALSYYRSFQVPVRIVRPFNTYGPRQSARAIIPTIISQILSGKKLIELGNLEPTRDFTFVKDTAKGFLKIAESDELSGEVTNVGMGEEISMGNLTDLIAKLIGVEVEVRSTSERIRPNASEVDRLFCSNKKLMGKTDWVPDYTLHSGLTETIEWMASNLDIYKADIYNV